MHFHIKIKTVFFMCKKIPKKFYIPTMYLHISSFKEMTCYNSYQKDIGVSQKLERSACLFRLIQQISLTFSKPATDHGETMLCSRRQWWPLLLPQWPFAIIIHGEWSHGSCWWRRFFRCCCLIVVCAAVWTQCRGLGIGGVVCLCDPCDVSDLQFAMFYLY